MKSNTTDIKNYNDNGISWLIIAMLIGTSIRGYFLSQPMRYDESYTFLNFVNGDFNRVFYYPLPNNHVLHSLLTKISTIIWGPHPVSIRFVAFLTGIASIPVVYIFSRTLKQSGLLASFAFAVFPYFVLYSTNARGYTLLVFLTLILALTGMLIVKQPSLLQTILFSLIAAFGMLTMPSMLFPIAGIYFWVFLLLLISGHTQKQQFYTFAVPCVLLTSLFTIILYIPVILASNGIQSIVANRFVKAQPWEEFLSQVYPHFQQTFIVFTRDIPNEFLLIAAILFVIGIGKAIQQKKWPILLIVPSILLTSGVIFIIKHKIPFARTWIYIIPFFILVADNGFTWVISISSDKIQFCIKIIIVGFSFYFALSLMSNNTIASYPDTGTFAEAELVAKFLKPMMSTSDKIHVRVPANYPVYYYMWYHQVPRNKRGANLESRIDYFVVKKNQYSIKTNTPLKVSLDIGNLTVYQSIKVDD
jgi:hypothetical protein